MLRRSVKYPFEPKSTAYLEPGQFWALPLSDGRYGCGQVLAVRPAIPGDPNLPLSSRVFLAGVLDWVGASPPRAATIEGRDILAYGNAHILAIRESGGQILGVGEVPDDLYKVRTAAIGGEVYQGWNPVKLDPGQAISDLSTLSTWGFNVAHNLAEMLFVEKREIIRSGPNRGYFGS